MKKRTIVGLSLALLLSACTVMHFPPQKSKVDFSRFSLIRLTPTALPEALSKMIPSKKAAAQLNRELLIRLSKCLIKNIISPTNDIMSKSMLNILPAFKVNGQGLILSVLFQDNATGEIIVNQAFNVPNHWGKGFENSEMDRLRLAQLAQQVIDFIKRSQ